MKALVGYTGFVGSNLAANGDFDGLYNSKNVKEAYGTNPDVLYYSGVPAAKFIANKFPEMDMSIMKGAVENIRKINIYFFEHFTNISIQRWIKRCLLRTTSKCKV